MNGLTELLVADMEKNPPQSHKLKTWPEYFQRVMTRQKTFELRKNDRDFQVGDKILLQEYDPQTQQYTGNEYHTYIKYMIENKPDLGLKPGYCIFGIEVF